MGKKYALSLIFAASLLLAGCEKGQATAVPTVVEPTRPVPTALPLPTEEPTQQLQVTPVAVFGQVGYIPGVFPGLGGVNWEFTAVRTLSGGGDIVTDVVRSEGFTPLAVDGTTVSMRAEGANQVSFFLVPRLDQAQYIRADGSVGVATFSQDLSFELVTVYADEALVIYQQPGAMTDFRDGTAPILGREDSTGDVWVLYVASDGVIVRRAPAFFGSQDSVQVSDGKVLVNGENMLIAESAWTATPTQPYRINANGVPEEFANVAWQEVALPEIPESLQPTVILGENGLFQVKVQLTDYEVPPDGLVIGEYSDGLWHPVPFAFARSTEATKEALGMDFRYFGGGEIYRMNPNGIDTASYPGPFQGMRLEIDEASETRLTMLQINLRDKRVLKFVPESLGALGVPIDPRRVTVQDVANLIVAAEEHVPLVNPEDPLRRVSFGAIFYIVTDRATEYICSGFQAGTTFTDYCFEMLGDKERSIKTLEDFQRLYLGGALKLTPQVLESGVDWWDDELIIPISRQNAVWVISGFPEAILKAQPTAPSP